MALILGYLFKGRLKNLAELEFTALFSFILAFLIQFLIDYQMAHPFIRAYGRYLHLFSYLLLFYGIYKNIKLPGMGLIGLGVFLNFLVIAANGGYMPADPRTISPEWIAMMKQGILGTHTLIDEHTRLVFLADNIYLWFYPITFSYGKPIISFGDIFITVGVFWLVFKGMRYRKNKNYKLTVFR
ncbi:DUF5317 domain-containing protein [Carboxydothermus islandicus]|uniref:DUF5317 domain-containing protein n=1 Tax=Carboxydothermus islandicus TaxID=661089 RepID=UPI00096A45E5|nr:DUF5317 domain-containing protein [Carboxydothermus islandicus]